LDFCSFQLDLEILIGNVLDAFASIDPAKIIDKMKLQVLPNLVDDIRRFGPAIRYSTEIFECFNAIFRLCSVLSNHQAPSRDIANKFASMDRLKHMLSGGYWKVDNEWVRAGSKVRDILRKDTFIQRHLGWVPTITPIPGASLLSSSCAPQFNQFHRLCSAQSKSKIPHMHMGGDIGFRTDHGPINTHPQKFNRLAIWCLCCCPIR
jgi:hypothetical protein